jgi:NAD(P)-dependent dehydrogenase (short-subunit alcohol dehydrogenase family)
MFARSPEFIGKLAAELGLDVLAVPTDVSDANEVAAGFRKVRQQLGSIEILIAHASGSVGEGLMKTTPAQFEQSWRVAYSVPFSAPAKPCLTCSSAARAQLFSPAQLLQCVGAAAQSHLAV